jgi:hypothetical protein
MSIITRPIKTGGGTDYVAGNDELAQEFNDDANTIYNDYNGNITDANCSLTMGLQGTKLADAPNGVSTSKINDSAVTTAKILDSNVTGIKIANTTIPTSKLKNLVIESIAFSNDSGVGTAAVAATICRFTSGANYVVKVSCLVRTIANQAITVTVLTLTPVTTIPTATKDVIAMYLENVATVGTIITGNVIIISIDKT